jgi:hypothetical protein
LSNGAVEIGLLFGDGVFGASYLIGARWIASALVQSGKLAFEAHANWIRGRRRIRYWLARRRHRESWRSGNGLCACRSRNERRCRGKQNRPPAEF